MDIIEIIFRHHPELASAMMRGEGIGADLTRGQLRRMFGTLRHRPRKETEAIIRAFRQNPAALRNALAQSAGFGSGATGARLALSNPMLARGRSALLRGGGAAGLASLAIPAILDADKDLPGIQADGTTSQRGRMLGHDTLRQTPFSMRPEDMVRMSDIIYEGAEDPRRTTPAGASQTMTLQDELDNFERMQRQVAEGRAEAGTLAVPGSPRTRDRRSRLERALVEQARGLDEATLSAEAAQRRQEAHRQAVADFNNNRVRPAAPIMPRDIRPDEPEMGGGMQSVLEELLAMDRMVPPPSGGKDSPVARIPVKSRGRGEGQAKEVLPDIGKPAPRTTRQFVPSNRPGVMGSWQDLPYELQPATTLSEREILRLIRGE
jgi:hypothetical protein